jgi:hypothetical protein
MTKLAATAFLLFIIFAPVWAKHTITQSDARAIFAPQLNDEARGIIFFASGPANQTFNVTTTLENCDDAMADISSNQHFVTELWDRGFIEVACTATINGTVSTRTQKIGPAPQRKPRSKPGRHDRENWEPHSA